MRGRGRLRSKIDIVLKEQSVDVDTVVVTALGIKRSEKALSYNVQQVAADAITSNKDVNFINALNGKVAGVNINASSAGVGGASKVVMRGTKSISQSSNALYVIDGVPMFTKAKDGGTESEFFAGYDRSHRRHQSRGYRIHLGADRCRRRRSLRLGCGQRRNRRDDQEG